MSIEGATGFATCLEERQQDLVADAWAGAKRCGAVLSPPDANR